MEQLVQSQIRTGVGAYSGGQALMPPAPPPRPMTIAERVQALEDIVGNHSQAIADLQVQIANLRDRVG